MKQSDLPPIPDDVVLIDGDPKAREVMAAEGPKIFALIEEAERLAKAKGNPRDKFERLVTIAETFSKTVTPYLPCKEGCSHCCYMSVAISDIEAEAISRYTGRAMAQKGTIEKFLRESEAMIDRYTAVPCTFLDKAGKCSVYVVRPIACRTHHNLGPSPDNCIVKDVVVKCSTPKLRVTEFDSVAVDIAMSQANVGFADIREFFP